MYQYQLLSRFCIWLVVGLLYATVLTNCQVLFALCHASGFFGGTGQACGTGCGVGSGSTAAVTRMMPDCTCKWVAYGIPGERPCLRVGMRLSKRAWTMGGRW